MADQCGRADAGFHRGELAAQEKAGVRAQAARLAHMLEPVQLGGTITAFLHDRSFAAMTARGRDGRLWVSPLIGPPGFLQVIRPSTVQAAAVIPPGDPLHLLPTGQTVGLVVIEFSTRRRVRINGLLAGANGAGLTVNVEQAYGNCPQYIQQRSLAPVAAGGETTAVRSGAELLVEDVALIRAADTFILGTTNPERGKDASHRGGPPGFVRVDGQELWWPDYAGNNLFNSFGNLEVNPETGLLFLDFANHRTLHLSGTARVDYNGPGQPGDDGATGRRARFRVEQLVAGHALRLQQVDYQGYSRNPHVDD
jgi:uncharacterized protein